MKGSQDGVGKQVTAVVEQEGLFRPEARKTKTPMRAECWTNFNTVRTCTKTIAAMAKVYGSAQPITVDKSDVG